MREDLIDRLTGGKAMASKEHASDSVADARAHVEAMLGLQVWSNAVHRQIMAEPHQHLGANEHE